MLAIVHLRFGRFDEANACFDRALALNPKMATTVTNKALALVEQHRFDEAFAFYAKSLAIDRIIRRRAGIWPCTSC